jgi:acyl-CoA thioester hydrolase
MFVQNVQPRFAETDALGHINNAVLPVWFEQARTPIFKIFVPNLDVNKWNLILAKIEVEFLQEIFYGQDVEVRSFIEKIGNSSFVCYQEAWQSEVLVAKGRAVMVYFDHTRKKSMPIPAAIKATLNEHLVPKS